MPNGARRRSCPAAGDLGRGGRPRLRARIWTLLGSGMFLPEQRSAAFGDVLSVHDTVQTPGSDSSRGHRLICRRRNSTILGSLRSWSGPTVTSRFGW